MIRGRGYQGNVAAAVQFDDEKEALLDAGLDAVFNIPNEAGASLAAHICDTQKIS
jgi:glutathione-regulated potassium-efflux system ancillary protein KefC